jgi:hypothetical protein
MATLIPSTSQQSQQQSASSVEAYEDMFKEITRKLYGDDSAHGLYPHNTQITQQRMEPSELLKEQLEGGGGERSFTTLGRGLEIINCLLDFPKVFFPETYDNLFLFFLVSDRNLALEFESGGVIADNNNFKSEDHLTTAFGLAALMQNGFPATSILNPVSFPVTTTKQSASISTSQNNDENRWIHAAQQQQQNNQNSHQPQQSHHSNNHTHSNHNNNHHVQGNSQQNQTSHLSINLTNSSNNQQTNQQQQQQQQQSVDEIMPWNPNKISNSYIAATQKLLKVKTKQEPLSTAEIVVSNVSTNSIVSNTNTLPTNVTIVAPTVIKTEINPIGQIQKRYNCSSCPYSTDRRDLFTRHENIHKDEKPFFCYACLKQFNRADHVKKHFLRMHREMTYDINKTRRYPSSKHSANNNIINQNNQNSNNTLTITAGGINANNFFTQSQISEQTASAQPALHQPQQSTLNNSIHTTTISIPTTFSQQQQQQLAQAPTTNSQAHTIEQVVQNAVNQQNLVISNNLQTAQQSVQQAQTTSAQQSLQQALNQQQALQPSQVSQAQPIQVQTITNIITNIKHEKTSDIKPIKKKGEKRFLCCYCSWTGADNWGLKR